MAFPSVSVFGLGYVGSVTSACLAQRGCRVVGCDVSEEKVALVNAGEPPIREPGLDELTRAEHSAGRLSATVDAAEAVRETQLSLVCVGTPSSASGALDLGYVETVAGQIAEAVRAKGEPHAVVFRSTMLPGSTRRLAEAYFGEASGLGDLVSAAFYPEFLRQGSALADFRDPSLSVLGVLGDPATPEALAPFGAVVEPATAALPAESAELLKYACNAFHAAKVGFANEIGRIGKALGVDAAAVMEALCRDERLNISPYYLRPGTPYGGSCLPKDLSALVHQARALGVATPLLDSLAESNRRHLETLLARIEAAGSRRVLLLGLAFKAGTDDLRGSAMLELASELLLKGYELRIHDPAVAPASLVGANQRFAAARLPRLESLLVDRLDGVYADGGPATLVAAKPCAPAAEAAAWLRAGEGRHFIDVNGWREMADLAPSYEGLCW